MIKSTRAKGNRNVRRCKDMFIRCGWWYDDCEKKGKYIKQKDLFGLFDGIAISKNSNKVRFIQVTSNRPHTHKKYQQFVEDYPLSQVIVEQWVYIDRKGFRIFLYKKGKKPTKTDINFRSGKK